MGSGWVDGEGEGGLRWATPVGAALTPFLINGAGSPMPLFPAGTRYSSGKRESEQAWTQHPCGLVP